MNESENKAVSWCSGWARKAEEAANQARLNNLVREHEEIRAEHAVYFKMVCNLEDWRNPIDACCRVGDVENVYRAIAFFTATEAVFTPLTEVPGWCRVQSIGYRAGPAGDH